MAMEKNSIKKHEIETESWIKAYCSIIEASSKKVYVLRAKAHIMSDHSKTFYGYEVDYINKLFREKFAENKRGLAHMFSKYEALCFFDLSPIGLANNKSSTLKYEVYLKETGDYPSDVCLKMVAQIAKQLNDVIKYAVDYIGLKIKE